LLAETCSEIDVTLKARLTSGDVYESSVVHTPCSGSSPLGRGEDELIKEGIRGIGHESTQLQQAAGLRKQEGTTLIVAMVLLLLASLLAVFAMNVGLLAQRTSSADLRSRVVHQTRGRVVARHGTSRTMSRRSSPRC
jgi:hypothetical protein